MKNLTYRKATLDDLEKIKVLNLKAFNQYADVLSPENWDRLHYNMGDADSLISMLEKSTTFLCISGEELAGVVSLMPHGNPTHIFPAEWAYVRRMGVLPEYRGQGIAKQLMLQLIAEAKAQNETTLALHTSEFMETARLLYAGLGFEIERELDILFGKRCWLYKLNLK
jgi:ribosomal protein S18 acetylase RimI-like enzyme